MGWEGCGQVTMGWEGYGQVIDGRGVVSGRGVAR